MLVLEIWSSWCFKNVEAKERIWRSDLQKSSRVSGRVLLVSHFSPDTRHRTGESTNIVIWKLVNMGRRSVIVGSIETTVSFLDSKWILAIQIWCYRGLGSSKGHRPSMQPMAYITVVTKAIVQERDVCLILHVSGDVSCSSADWRHSKDTAFRTDKAGSFLENSVERINRSHEKKNTADVFWYRLAQLQTALAAQS